MRLRWPQLAGALLGLVLADQAARRLTGHALWEQRSGPPPSAVWEPAEPPPSSWHPLTGTVLRPDIRRRHHGSDFDVTVSTSSQGFRDDVAPEDRPAGQWRALVLGDSYTFAWGVPREAGFVEQLEGLLLGHGSPVECINTGVPGWNPSQVLLWLREQGRRFEVDLWLLQVAASDVHDLGNSPLTVGTDGLPTSVGTSELLDVSDEALLRRVLDELQIDVDEALERYSRNDLDATLRMAVRRVRKLRERATVPPADDVPLESLAPEVLSASLRGSPVFRARYLLRLLEAIQTLGDEAGVPVRFLLVDGPRAEAPDDPATTLVQAWFAEHRAVALDLSRAFPLEPSQGWYFAHDAHWTPRAHAEAARRLAAWLADDPALGLRPADDR